MENFKNNGQHNGWIEGEVRLAWFKFQKWMPKPLHGCGVTLTLRDGSEAQGHYMIVESGAVTACCHPFGGKWMKPKGFPADGDGMPIAGSWYQTPNGRKATIETGDDYGGEGFDGGSEMDVPVVVSFEGVVMHGQRRTMAGIRAAKHGTDAAYIAWLRNHCARLGFSVNELDQFPHPRLTVYLRRGEVKEYSAQEFDNYRNAEIAFRKL